MELFMDMEDLTNNLTIDLNNHNKTEKNITEDNIKKKLNDIFSKFNNLEIKFNNKIIELKDKNMELNNKLDKIEKILNDTVIELETLKKNNQNTKNNQPNTKNNQPNQNKANKSTKNKSNKSTKNKIFKSASLTFVDDELGYLLCDEYRYREKNNLIHPIGGKVETYDKDLLETAIREFIEETNLEQYPYNQIDKSSKNKLIENIKMIISQDIQFYDFCVGKELGYYHRYYSFNLKKIPQSDITDEFIKSIRELPIFFNGNFKTEVNSLEWININQNINTDINQNTNTDANNEVNLKDKKFSHLTKMFFKYKH